MEPGVAAGADPHPSAKSTGTRLGEGVPGMPDFRRTQLRVLLLGAGALGGVAACGPIAPSLHKAELLRGFPRASSQEEPSPTAAASVAGALLKVALAPESDPNSCARGSEAECFETSLGESSRGDARTAWESFRDSGQLRVTAAPSAERIRKILAAATPARPAHLSLRLTLDASLEDLAVDPRELEALRFAIQHAPAAGDTPAQIRVSRVFPAQPSEIRIWELVRRHLKRARLVVAGEAPLPKPTPSPSTAAPVAVAGPVGETFPALE